MLTDTDLFTHNFLIHYSSVKSLHNSQQSLGSKQLPSSHENYFFTWCVITQCCSREKDPHCAPTDRAEINLYIFTFGPYSSTDLLDLVILLAFHHVSLKTHAETSHMRAHSSTTAAKSACFETFSDYFSKKNREKVKIWIQIPKYKEIDLMYRIHNTCGL